MKQAVSFRFSCPLALLQIQSLSLIPSHVADCLLRPLLTLCTISKGIKRYWWTTLLSLWTLSETSCKPIAIPRCQIPIPSNALYQESPESKSGRISVHPFQATHIHHTLLTSRESNRNQRIIQSPIKTRPNNSIRITTISNPETKMKAQKYNKY